jgi:hypothetical protein
VIGIIALLIAIPLPALNRAREAARSINCGSNLRQIGQALLMHANDQATGQYAAGTTFIEGLVLFHNKCFLYYECADSNVGVAIADVNPKVAANASDQR